MDNNKILNKMVICKKDKEKYPLYKIQATEISKDDLKGIKDGDFIKIII